MKMIFFLLGAVLTLGPTETYSANSTHYLAAVVEYAPKKFDPITNGREVEMANVFRYEYFIRQASDQGVDIIVFPEVGLTGVYTTPAYKYYTEVPHPHDFVCPCVQREGWGENLQRLSCAARARRIYVVVNLREKKGTKRYNTNVVFNRDGVVIARYRKLHLFNEPEFSVPEKRDYGVFHTDFGVVFGTSICFDLMFREPASELVHTRNIRHFVFSTAWYSEVPFLSATQAQAAWSWSHDAVLLASGLNTPSKGCTGSGIYLGRMGSAKEVFTGLQTQEMLTAWVPKNLATAKKDFGAVEPTVDKKHFESIAAGDLFLKRNSMQAFATQLLPVEGTGEENFQLCHDYFCCDFEMRRDIKKSNVDEAKSSDANVQRYRLFAWNGVRDFSGAATGGVQLCAVVACKDPRDVRSCGVPVPLKESPRDVTFSKLKIRGIFEKNNTMLLASTLSRFMVSLPGAAYTLTEDDDERCTKTTDLTCVNMSLQRDEGDLQTFAIYNRVFDRDNSSPTDTQN